MPANKPPLVFTTVAKGLRDCAAVGVHRLILAKMSAEAAWTRFHRGPRKARVLAIACWHFPTYSHTFVYREIAGMATNDFEVRFAYSGLASRRRLPEECALLWRMKCWLIRDDAVAARDLEHYRKRMPDRVQDLVSAIRKSSGLTREEIVGHRHFRHAFSFTRMAEVWKADYIHTYFFYEATLFGFVAAWLLGIPRGVTCYADHMLDDYAFKLVRLQLQSCDVVVATSGRIKKELEVLAGGPLPTVIVKPNGIDTSRFTGAGRLSSPREGVFRLVSVSRIHPKKGLLYLLEAALLLRDQGFRFVLEILGEPDAHEPHTEAHYQELKDFAATNKLQEQISFRGRKSAIEVHRYLARADVFVAPCVELPNGDKDGIPTALIEAMATGCAIVTTDAGSIPEVVRDGLEGIVVPQFDSAALVDAILRLAQDDRLRSRIAGAAIDRVRQEFDVSHCEAAFHQSVRKTVAASRSKLTQAMANP